LNSSKVLDHTERLEDRMKKPTIWFLKWLARWRVGLLNLRKPQLLWEIDPWEGLTRWG